MLIGLGRKEEEILGYIDLVIELNGHVCTSLPFAVTSEDSIPCCVLLGANYLILSNITLNFGSNTMTVEGIKQPKKFSINNAFYNNNEIYRFGTSFCLNTTRFSPSDWEQEERDMKVKYRVSTEDIKAMQS